MSNLADSLFDRVIRPARVRGKFRFLSPLLPKAGTRSALVNGCTMPLDLADLIQRSVFLGSFEFEESRWVHQILRSGDVAVDVGANCGYYSTLFAQLVGPSGTVIAFEPNPGLAERLSRVLAANNLTWVRLQHAGASDLDGSTTLYIPPPEWHNEDATMAPVEGWRTVKVPIRRLDDVLLELGDRPVRLMKLDIEGHEHRALSGARQTLAAGRVGYLLLELNDYWLREHQTSARELVDYCSAIGFKEIVKGGLPESGGVSSIVLRHQQVAS